MSSQREDHFGEAVEVVLTLRRSRQGRTVVDVRTTEPPLAYGTVDLLELPLLLEAVVADLPARPPDEP